MRPTYLRIESPLCPSFGNAPDSLTASSLGHFVTSFTSNATVQFMPLSRLLLPTVILRLLCFVYLRGGDQPTRGGTNQLLKSAYYSRIPRCDIAEAEKVVEAGD